MGEENLLRTPAVRYDIHLTDFSNLQMYSAFVSCLVLITNHTIDNRSQIATTRRKKKKKKKEERRKEEEKKKRRRKNKREERRRMKEEEEEE
jgi:hypothetical protein